MSYPAQFLNRGHIYGLLIKNLIFDHKAASTAANKKYHQWDVRQVLPIGGIFAERCICSLLIENWVWSGFREWVPGVSGIMGTMGIINLKFPSIPSIPSIPSLGPLGPLRP